ncbi:MAG: tetratricopeptide repeat protein [Myxococcaceae bacterium]
MSARTPQGPVERWRDAPDAEASQAKAAALVGRVPAPAELSDEQLERIGERLVARARRVRAPMPSWLKWAIGAGAFGGAPLAFAAVLRLVFAPAVQDELPRPSGEGLQPAAVSPAAVPMPMPMEIDLTAPGGAALVRPEDAPAQAGGSGEDGLAPGPQKRAGPDESGASAQIAGHGGLGADSPASPGRGAMGAASGKLAGPGGSGTAKSAPGGAATWAVHRERGTAPARVSGTAAPALAAAPPPSPAAGGASSLEAESALLSTALSRLRLDKDPSGALEALDEHRRQFPRGVLRDEERVGRVDALLALGRRPEALAELEAIGAGKLEQLPRGTDLRVLEAELLSESKRCDRAVPLFDALLARPLPAAADERALFGRASCRVELGEPDGAAADLRRCLARHPSGRFAAAARRLLEGVADE